MKKILVIEDDPYVREMIVRHLEQERFHVLLAENGQIGLEMFKLHLPPVVLLDLKMPVLDGLGFLQAMSADELKKHAIIVLTGQGGDSEMELCYHLGVHSFLNKPVNIIELKGLLKRTFDLLDSLFANEQMNQRLRFIMGHLPDVVWELDQNLNLLYISDNVEEMLGYTPKEMVGKAISEFLVAEDIVQFHLKFQKDMLSLQTQILNLTLQFKGVDGLPLPLQISAKPILQDDGIPSGIVGTLRDKRAFSQISNEVAKVIQEMTIRINDKLQLVYADEKVSAYLPKLMTEAAEPPLFSDLLKDPTLVALLGFSFNQQEDMPFPVEVELFGKDLKPKHFSIKFQYQAQSHCLEGQLLPSDPVEQMALLSQRIEKQEDSLKNAVVVDVEMQQNILLDSQHLADEILTLIKSIESFAVEESKIFNLEEYLLFIHNKNLYEYCETLRLLGNKVHGLKGSTGFLMPAAKKICHRIEEITRPLAEIKFVYTRSLARLLKQFIFKIQEMLEQYANDAACILTIDDFILKIDQALSQAQSYIGSQGPLIAEIINKRSIDHGEIRKRKKEDYLSVTQSGYISLSQQVKSLFYMLSDSLKGDHLVKAGNLYNEFLDTHQQIKKMPLDMSRYERLIPSIGEQYGKQADFNYVDHGVKADREFWNAMHEIFNHSLKNAVIHGLESPQEREQAQKAATGQVQVEVREDALNIFISIADDGRGINVEKIKAKAVENGVRSAAQLDAMSPADIFSLVFVQGISTAEKVDDNAGRGVGMNAVQEAMKMFNGLCHITSTLGKGSTWNFTFPKSNVSLPCFIVTIGSFYLAIPEDSVEAFHGFQETTLTTINQRLTYRHGTKAIPLVETQSCFDEDVTLEVGKLSRILILKAKQEKIGLVINEILHHATLPILPLPEDYRRLSIYTGATLFGNSPVLVLNVPQLL